jgi:hypothetical protein
MAKTPHLNGMRSAVICPACRKMFVNRRHKACPRCKIGLKYKGEFIYEGDWYWDEYRGWVTYDDLLEETTP